MNSNPKHKLQAQVFVMVTDPILRDLYHKGLSNINFCIVWCDQGDWKESLSAFHYDVILIDLSLFTERPLERLAEIQNISPTSDVIVISEHEDAQMVIDVFKLGISDFYLKPTNPETLSWSIEKILRRKSLKTTDVGLTADLAVFSATHQISYAESDIKMRELAIKHLIDITEATGAVWVWADTDRPKNAPKTRKSPYRIESFQSSREHAVLQFELFQKRFPNLLEKSFENKLKTRSELYFKDNFAWIPLQYGNLGGILLCGINSEMTKGMQARAEFLVHNLEVSLENYRRYAEARQLTYIDDLTGLYNSRYLDITLNAAISKLGSESNGFCVLFMDLDHFKSINDNHGHITGSQTLVHVAKALKLTLRKIDHLFRYGGDEFIAILYEVNLASAQQIAERIRKGIEMRLFHILGKEIKVTLSIGIARFPEQGKDKKTILQMADKAMYEGKKSGRNKIFIAQIEPV